VGTNLIEASAGTGKTYAIATLYVRSLLETKARVENILVVTYTRAATAELRDRIRRRIEQTREALRLGKTSDEGLQKLVDARMKTGDIAKDRKRLTLALRSFDQASIFTIHGFCQRVLQETAFESGTAFESEFEADDKTLAAEIADDFWAREMFAIDATRFAYYQAQGLTPAPLRKLAQDIIGNPDLGVLPEANATNETKDPADDEAMTRFEASFQRACSHWQDHRDEIVELLIASPQLNKRSYKPAQISEKYAPAIDQLLAPEAPGLVADDHALHKLSTEGLAPLKGTNKGKEPPVHDFFALASTLIADSAAVASAFEAEIMALRLRLVDYVRCESIVRKNAQSTLSFDDLLLQLRTALRKPQQGHDFAENIAASYPIALIDEFQDTDPVQYEIFRRIYYRDDGGTQDRALFLIGDPKQAIYGFRGADLFTYFRARSDAGEQCHTLATNYRSSPAMVDATNAILSSPKDTFLFEELQFSPVAHAPSAENLLDDPTTDSAALEILLLDRKRSDGSDGTQRTKPGVPKPISKERAEPRCARRIAGEIVRLLRSDATIEVEGDSLKERRAVAPGDIAVLVRKNKQALLVQEALARLDVPSVLESDSSVFLTSDAVALGRVLQAIAHPSDRNAIRAALASDILGRNGNEIAALATDEDGWEQACFAFRGWHETWAKRGFYQAFSQMMSEADVASRLLSRPDGERRMTNLGQLAELLQERALLAAAGPQVLCAWLETMRVDTEARNAVGEAAQLRLETDAAAVKVVTVHKSKGLEYGIVFCPFLWEGQPTRINRQRGVRFHDESDGNHLKIDLGSDDIALHRGQASRESLAEDLRLVYVALTRAKHRCSVVCGPIASVGSSALAYLLFRNDALPTDWEALQKFAKSIETLEDSDFADRLQRHVRDGIAVRPLLEYEGEAYQQAHDNSAALASQQCHRSLSTAWRTSSFSGLTRNAEADHDHDAGVDITLGSLGDEDMGEVITMETVPAGAHPGQMLHDIFERMDFATALQEERPSEDLATVVGESLEKFGFDASRWEPTITRALGEVLGTSLNTQDSATDFRLADIPRANRLDELEFHIPIRHGDDQFRASALADALAEREASPWAPSYLDMVRNLGFRPLSGFLKGFMDLVFVHEGRWYLVDYKSNKLGTRHGDYSPESMARSMSDHHYTLQYHIYLVALDRYLRLRLPGYAYEQDFGGVFYLFIRGMHPDAPVGNGVFFDRPSATDIERLHRAFEGETV